MEGVLKMSNIIMYMGLSGSIALALYYIFLFIWRKSATAVFRYRLLKLAMCFYLIPLPYFSSIIRDIIQTFIPGYSVNILPEETWIHDISDKIYNTPKGYVFPGHSLWIVMSFIFGTVITIIILFQHYRNYCKLRELEGYLSEAPASLTMTANKLKQELHIRRKISLLYLKQPYSPFCYGFIKPKIVISEGHASQEYEMLLLHEFWHIKSGDYIIRLLAFFIIALHFLNPMVYLLFYEINKVSELACDEHVLHGYSKEQRTLYGNLLLNITPTPITKCSNSFGSNSNKIMKERITMIKYPRKMKRFISTFCAAIIVCCSTLPVAAYEPLQVEQYDSDLANSTDMYMFALETETDAFTDFNENYFADCDCFFVTEDGATFQNPDTSKIETKGLCFHTYKHGNLYRHSTHSDGGCTYTVYSADVCTKCKKVINQEYVATVTYAKCPHK